MMKRLHLKKNNRQRSWIPYAVGMGVVALMFASLLSPSPKFLGGVAHTLALPFKGFGALVGAAFSPIVSVTQSREALLAENDALRAANETMLHQNLVAQYLQQENTALRAALGRIENERRGILAAVLAGPGRSPFDTFIIDAGMSQGIEEGGLVVSSAGFALGTISRTYDKSAVVTLFSTPGAETSVMIGTTSMHVVKAEGRGAGAFAILMPREMPVAVGEPVALTGSVPRILGTTAYVLADETSAFQTVHFTYAVNVFSLRYVVVLPPPVVPHAWDALPTIVANPAPTAAFSETEEEE